ncbi:MAG: NUDIX domain-containing protein [Alphaproteobacteria bacterium]
MTHTSYTWPLDQPAPNYERIFLDDHTYGQAIQAFPIICSDIVPLMRAPNRLVLAQRNNKPMQGWWHFGGRWMMGEDGPTAACRHFKRDTGTILSTDRLIDLGIRNYLWHDRQQAPQDTPCQSVAFTYGVEMSDNELAHMAAKINLPEYVPGTLCTFTWERLQEHDIHPVLRDLYQAAFSERT